MCVITMMCWGSWANTQKLASNEWQFQRFYWAYSIGVLAVSYTHRTLPTINPLSL